MLNPSGLYPGDNWIFFTGCNNLGSFYTQAIVRTGPWAVGFSSRLFGGLSTCGSAKATMRNLVPGRTYKVLGWWNAQGVSTNRNLFVTLDGGVGGIGSITGVTADAATWQGFAFAFVARQATHVITFAQPAGTSITSFTRYIDDVAVALVAQGVAADLSSLAPTSLPESLAPTATLEPDSPGGEPGYGG